MRRLSLLSDSNAAEPITTAVAKAHLRIDQDDEDALIADLGVAAREYFEEETGRQLIETTWEMRMDGFPTNSLLPIVIPRPPLQSVTSITYNDGSSIQTWDASKYTVETPAGIGAGNGLVYPKVGENYPTTAVVPGAVTVTFVAGYGHDLVPSGIKRTLLALIGDLYANRETQITGTVVADNRTLLRMMHRWRLPVMA